MGDKELAQERLLAVAQEVDFARRYYAICVPTFSGRPRDDLPATEVAAALEATGRAFRFNRRESFYATRERGAPGELGVNLCLKHGVAEFILVARTPAGHVGDAFTALAANVARRYAPELLRDPPYLRPWFRDAGELRLVLRYGFGLYADLASRILASGLLSAEAEAGTASDRGHSRRPQGTSHPRRRGR
jgi:hypothetical protein